jgi:hypothetical protein
MSAVRWIELQYEISFFHLANIRNGFSPSLLINFTNDVPSDEEMDMLIRRTNQEYKGAGSAGKVIYTFSKDKDSAPVITPIDPNNTDSRFLQLSDEMTQGIFTGHRVTNPSIFGVRDKNGFVTGKSDLLDSLEMFQSMYVTPKQNFIEKTFQRLMNINGINDVIAISEYQMKFSKLDLGISELMSIITAQISKEQKIAILTSNGYEEKEAEEFVGTGTLPIPAVPDKTNTTA